MQTNEPLARPINHTTSTEVPIIESVKRISEQLSVLVRNEVELSKRELRTSIERLMISLLAIWVAGVMLFLGMVYLTISVTWRLAQDMEGWVASAIVAGVLLSVGYILFSVSRRKAKATVRRSADSVRSHISELTEAT